ncbi:MAG: GNAT family N-acetyltransferase [Chromatiales bacterium]|jgi:GNAT superfamily N-acetyltransferase|nr:GNAT family N-acetyltransferase [Chromatiales bacterium]
MAIKLHALSGEAIAAVLPDLARLRITVFRDWPYLYDGSEAYEREYLARFAAARGAVCVVARDGEAIVGASTAAPMAEEAPGFAAPFRAAGHDLANIFYCGESVLLRAYRGQGIGHRFFDLREAHARALGGFSCTTFCRVIRAEDHPLRPADYIPLDAFWRKRGYAPMPGFVTHYDWKDIDQPEQTSHPMEFWMKSL